MFLNLNYFWILNETILVYVNHFKAYQDRFVSISILFISRFDHDLNSRLVDDVVWVNK